MMKKFALMLLVALAGSSSYAQTTVRLEMNQDSKYKYDVLSCKDDSFAFACVKQDWAQAYAGKIVRPAPWCEIAFGGGLEQAPNPWRVGGWFWAGKGKGEVCLLAENGGSGPWHEFSAKAKLSQNLKVGAIDRSFYGQGAVAEYKLGGCDKVTAAWYDGGKSTLAFSHSF